MKALIKYLSRREKLIARLMATPRTDYTPETFHKLRVELKKLSSLFEILEYCSHDFKQKKYFKTFKDLFLQAGKVRELQITENLLKKYFDHTSLLPLRQYLTMQKQSTEDGFFSLTTKLKRSKLKLKFEVIRLYVLQATKKKIRQYLEKNRNTIEKIVAKENIKKDDVHALRKRIKTYNYNRRILEKNSVRKNANSTDHLSNLAGQWHDLRVTLDFIESSKKHISFEPGESELLLEGTKKIDAECEQLFNDILKAVLTSEFYKEK